jgi:DNA polymerase-3 subunit delta'
VSVVKELAPWVEADLERLLAQRGHAWLITGMAGLGQFEIAMAMAASALCEKPATQEADKAVLHKACGQCGACHMVFAKSHPDR